MFSPAREPSRSAGCGMKGRLLDLAACMVICRAEQAPHDKKQSNQTTRRRTEKGRPLHSLDRLHARLEGGGLVARLKFPPARMVPLMNRKHTERYYIHTHIDNGGTAPERCLIWVRVHMLPYMKLEHRDSYVIPRQALLRRCMSAHHQLFLAGERRLPAGTASV